MNESAQAQVVDDEEISIWELIEHLRSGWRWLAGGCVVGLLGAAGALFLLQAKYEASVVVQPATIGSATTYAEPVAQTLERLKLVAFYNDEIVKACQVGSAQTLAAQVKGGAVKNSSLLSISYRADSAEIAKSCLAKIVDHLAQVQADAAAPLIKEMEAQLKLTQQQIRDLERFVAFSEKPLSSAANGSVALLLKQEELTKLSRLYREQRLQLSALLTRALQPLEPIYASSQAVSPRKAMVLVLGLAAGLFAGLFALIMQHSLRRYRSMRR